MRLTRAADVHVVWGGAGGGVVYGAVTGVVLYWLLRSFRREDDTIKVVPPPNDPTHRLDGGISSLSCGGCHGLAAPQKPYSISLPLPDPK
jgi:hypothetical protein